MAKPFPYDDCDELPDYERADQLEREYQEERFEIQKDEN